MITIRSLQDIAKMRKAGRVVALALEAVGNAVKPGVTTLELNAIAEDVIRTNGAIPSFKGYGGHGSIPPFPGSICASVNEQVVHGIPSSRVLQQGEIISIDCGAILDGWHGDAARTVPVGTVSEPLQKLMAVTQQSFYEGIAYAKAPYRLQDMSHAIQAYVEQNGFSVVRSMCGHGIGREMHEDPEIPNYGTSGRGIRLRKGMVFAIEPMVNVGDYRIVTLQDGWTSVTIDGLPSSHYENTIALTDGEPEILTVP